MHLAAYAVCVASIVEKRLGDGSRAYLVRYRMPDGTQRSKQFKRKRDAEGFVNFVEVDRMQGNLIDPRLGRITVAEWYAKWWPTVNNLRRTTKSKDHAHFRTHVLPTFGNVPLAALDRTSLRSWVHSLSDTEGAALAPATVHRVVQVFNKCVRAAHEDRLIVHNPVEHLPLPRIERKEMRFIGHEELWHLAEVIDPRFRSFVLLGGYGGLRLGEMLALRWGRVDFLRRRVKVVETLTSVAGDLAFGPPKTRAAVRSVPLPRPVCDELARLATPNIDPDELVFRTINGLPIRAELFRRRTWAPATKAAGLAPLRIHDLRHSAVSLWIAEGAHPKRVAVLAGHTSVSVVLDRYGHLYPEHDDELAAALERRMRPPAARSAPTA